MGMAWVALLACLPVWALAASLTSHAPADQVEPERVVTLEHLETEVALALGLPVVGVSDKAGYERWVRAEADALADAADVGGRAEPSLERVIRLQPDLIIGSTWRSGGIAERLAQIAPLLLYRDLPKPSVSDQYSRMRALVTDLGERTGRAASAERVLDRLDEHLADAREQLAAAGHEGTPVVFAHPLPGNDRLRLFTANSLVAQVIQRLGLTHGWGAAPGDYGFRVVDIGTLRRLPAETHLIVAADRDGGRLEAVTGSPAWPELPLVRAGHYHRIERKVWPFGGPLSAMRLADRVVAALTESPADEGASSR